MLDDSIRLMAADLELGAAHASLLCPSCHGGRSGEHSMRVWRDSAGLGYRCYRNKCGAYGRISDAGSVPAPKRRRREKKPAMYHGEPFPLPAKHAQFYGQQFGLRPAELEHARVMFERPQQRHVWPIHDPFMRVRGHNLRAASADWQDPPIPVREPKWLTYFNQDYPRCAWHRMSEHAERLILVEDQISALKAAEVIDSCALLGTNLHADVAAEIARQGYRQIILALDQDATSTAYKLAGRYAGMLPIKPVPIPCDVKDMTREQIRELLT